ncbi:9906_t:CDS:2 [Funneliformis mosseae]|uniref:9906_t:CDS:1 n=1 Tax=Funneliformis mosseae TaxID=27381 RepID=A0A9N9FJY0_FUNMO|nr:9906_t:CDS:2 [Funneliformis mosseae]
MKSIIAGLLALLIKATNEGKSREQLPSILDSFLSSHNVAIEKNIVDAGKKDVDSLTEQKIIQQWKLNYGLFCDGASIQPSKKAVLVDDGDLDINLYKGMPIVFINTNNPDCSTSPLTIENHNCGIYSDVCINFPVIEITYKADQLESFSKFTDDEVLHELYGHFIAKKILAGGQLLIKNFSLAAPSQREILKFYIIWAYNLAKNNNETPFDNNSFYLSFLPRIETSKGVALDTLQKLSNWLRKLYQDNIINIISYEDLVSIKGEISSDKHPGIANYKEKLGLEMWVGNVEYVKLAKWIKDFHPFLGLAINKSNEVESSKKFAINFIEVPTINLRDESYFELINPTTKLEEILISNNIFSIKNFRNFPFIIINDDFNDKENIHLVVKYEQYEILISRDHIKPSELFKNAIEEALKSMKPFNALQDVFNVYGHLFPLRIILGKSLKNILTTEIFGTIEKINLKLPILSLQSYLNNFNITYLTTQKGEVVEEDDWFKKTNNDLEIIEYDEVISLYDVLEAEQKKNIDLILNNNLKVILTGINDLKDLDIDNIEHYKRINIELSLENENYEVFGSIITNDNLKSEDFFARFRLFDVNGFSVMIKPFKRSKVDIRTCHILWMIVGNPSKLSVFSPNNRDIQVDFIERSIALNVDDSFYYIKTLPLSKGNIILIDAYYPSTNYEPHSIFKLVEWEDEAINFQIIKSTYNESSLDSSEVQHGENINSLTNIEHSANIILHICILHSDYGSLRIDNHEKECDWDLFGYILTKENLNKKFEEIDKFDSIQNTIGRPFINDDVKFDSDHLSQNRGIVTKVPSEIISYYNDDEPMEKHFPWIDEFGIYEDIELLDITKDMYLDEIGNDIFDETSAHKKVRWGVEQTKLLLEYLKENKEKVRNLRGISSSKSLWMGASQMLHENKYEFTDKQCAIRYKNLRVAIKSGSKSCSSKSEIEEIIGSDLKIKKINKQ